MRLVEIKIENFRGYIGERSLKIDPLTMLIGRNDAGKSTILDALDIYFNDSPIEKSDCNVQSSCAEVTISCVFDDLPSSLIIDEQAATTLKQEYLLREDGLLEIVKTYDCSAIKGKLSGIFAVANHPSSKGIDDLLSLKITELKSKATQLGVNTSDINLTIKSHIRRAIWNHAPLLDISQRKISLKKESAKDAYDQISLHMPIYAIFRSDRPSTDQDAEAQDPLKAAVKAAIKRRENELNNVISDIKKELALVANRTVDKIREMSPELANQLNPDVKNKNWDSLFNISLTGEDDVPLNKRGSGTRRLVLLNFFRAQAEDSSIEKGTGVIYAIEEPETSQHPNHQMLLLDAFEELVSQDRCQILVTTHTPTLARRVDRSKLRFISKHEGQPTIEHGSNDETLNKIVKTLGVLPDHNVKVFLGVEGKHDINFLRKISSILHAHESDIPCLETAEKSGSLIFVPLGGSSLELWVSRLQELNCVEFYLTDRDVPPPAQPKYQAYLEKWNARGCTAWATSRRELENYIHPSILSRKAPGYSGNGAYFEDVPLLFAQALHCAENDGNANPWDQLKPDKISSKTSRAKRRLNEECVSEMTSAFLAEIDPQEEVKGWLRTIGLALNKS
jgi:AAA15 family ATPase/GTPase